MTAGDVSERTDENVEPVLESAAKPGSNVSGERALPFSFAKRHGVLICEITDGIGAVSYTHLRAHET